jgi:uncharacterized protein YbbC (DUF1343 family)
MPIDLILGDASLRESIEHMTPMDEIVATWAEDLQSFDVLRREYFIYPE